MIIEFRNTKLLLLLLLFFPSCSSIEIFKEKTEFAPYKEYKSFVITNKEIGHRGFNDAYLDAVVSEQLQYLLEEQGLKYERDSPDLVIRYTSNEDMRQKEVYNNRYPMWGGRVWDPWMYDPRFINQQNMVSTQNYQLMQIMVDFIDPKNEKILMQLTAVSEVTNPKDKNKKALKSIEKIAQTYKSHMIPTNK
ncbi:DUF4136 domain-containing protein [Cognataquiflexum rubidum]|uniref:DUF4136 domain-containing protein n=1 Tax=Cognataquiflexum rubidum TaxID=2922273 RepID=UPI001F12CDD5|nr:DUF4136 domain-containing protein [Cognataquiflexum rubidum]MCH6234443.1 DUF4136 domain-containing protein [Cognataquiflexum rubidum]